MADFSQLLQTLPEALAAEVVLCGDCGEVDTVTADSRQAGPGSVFVALRGSAADGHDYIDQAVARGCRHLVVEKSPGSLEGVSVARVRDTHQALGRLAAAVYDFPARSLTMIGLTGTNGKTTVSWIVEQMLASCGFQVGVIGTVNYRYRDRSGTSVTRPAPLTTPDPVALQALLREMVDAGVSHVVMETSSHALDQGRLEGINFDVAVFTNLSRDHLDYHGSMEEYFQAKKLLFTRYLKQGGRPVVVIDPERSKDDWGTSLAEELRDRLSVVTCGFGEECVVRATDASLDLHGFDCTLFLAGQEYGLHSSLTGRYNLLNVLAAAGVGKALGLDDRAVVKGLGQLAPVPGRLERVRLAGAGSQGPTVFVDYAHTPDALANVLQTLRNLVRGRLICIFGCGGDRDRGKRPLMGQVAGEYADIAVVTSDNPRSEDPQAIIDEICEGLEKKNSSRLAVATLFNDGAAHGHVSVPDRRSAIAVGCSLAGSEDIVLIAGKGHEEYQILGDKRIFFDDRLEAGNGLLTWNREHLLRATGGRVGAGKQVQLLKDISTDTRSVGVGDIFVALEGENFDGHDFVDRAVEAGAGAVIVHREVKDLPDDVLVIRVEDTLQALGDLAAHRRRLLGPDLQVVAITGSCGKTTVKEMTAAIFALDLQEKNPGVDPLLKTRGNFNNLIGLPLSLLPVRYGQRVAVLEMGMNQFGEIRRLTEIADPDIGCITNVQAAHLEGLGSLEGVARAKGELFAGMRPDSTAVVNLDNPQVRGLARNCEQMIGFAVTPAGRRHHPLVKATRIRSLGEQGMRFTLHIGDWRQRITVPVPGEHNVSNCAAAAAIAHGAGIDPETICTGLAGFENIDKRMQFMALPGGIRLLNDCYNANPGSMAAALETVSRFGENCRRVAVLGDMLELGSETRPAHEAVGRLTAQLGYDLLLAVGRYADLVAEGARGAGMAEDRIHCFAATADAAGWLHRAVLESRLEAGDWLLVKGSRGMRMEEIVLEMEKRIDTTITGGRN